MIVCIILKISFTLSAVKSFDFSALIKSSSNCARREFVSKRYVSSIFSMPLSIIMHRLLLLVYISLIGKLEKKIRPKGTKTFRKTGEIWQIY